MRQLCFPNNFLWFFFPFSAKIKNIINTEDAKAKLLAEQRNKKKDHGTSFVPTNIAVNYVQHNRCELSICTYRGLNGKIKTVRGNINVFSQSITRTWMHHRGTTDTEKSPKQGRCVWETQRNQGQRVRSYIHIAKIFYVSMTPTAPTTFWFHSIIAIHLSQTSQQWKGHRWLPLWEVQEDEPKILKSWIFF